MKIDSSFTNNFGNKFDNIIYIDFESNNEMIDNLGRCVTETKKEINTLGTDKSEFLGIFLHEMKNEVDQDYAFRIYRDYEKSMYHRHYDDLLISKLQEKQKDIKLTDFPIGVVSVNGYVVGQIICYYNRCKTIMEKLKYSNDIEYIKKSYMSIISIIEELIENNIYYGDIHSKNFLIDDDDKIKLIDFESQYIDFNVNELNKSMINKLIYMFKYLNKGIGFNIEYDSSMEDVKEKVLSLK